LDIESELALRREQPPIESVLSELKIIKEAALEALADIQADPTRLDEVAAEMKAACEDARRLTCKKN
jgi:hypothetical protein